MKGRNGTLITTLALVFAVISFVLCFGVLGISNSVQGTSVYEKKEWKLMIDNISKIVIDNNDMEVINEPSYDKNKINYGLRLSNAPSTAQFEFTLKNDGNIDGVVSEVNIYGIDDYKNNIEIELLELNVGDVIEAGKFIQVKVITKYTSLVVDEQQLSKIVSLDNIEIDIKFNKIE